MKTHVTIMMLFLALLANTAFADPESLGELQITVKNNTAHKKIIITVTRNNNYFSDCNFNNVPFLGYLKVGNDWQLTDKYSESVMDTNDETIFQYQVGFIDIPSNPPDTICWGKYMIKVKSTDGTIDNFIIVDFTDENYGACYFSDYCADINIDYIVGNSVPFKRVWNNDTIDIPNRSTIGVWKWDEEDINGTRTPRTVDLPLPSPSLEPIGIYNYNPLLLIYGNVAPFPVSYDIYRKRNVGSYTLIASISNSTIPDTCTYYEYVDEQITTNGTGDRLAYYYVVARNATPNSQKVSGPSSIQSILFDINMQKNNNNGQLIDFELYQNYPNPFNPMTTISYLLPYDDHARLCIYNLTGQLVNILVNQYQVSGAYEISWNGTSLFGNEIPSGVYLYKLDFGNMSKTRKLVLLK